MPRPQSLSPFLGGTATTSCLRAVRCTATSTSLTVTKRSFSSLPTLRPTLLSQTRATVFRPSNSCQTALSRFTPTTIAAADGAALTADIVPVSAISAHPALAGLGMQIRCGPRPNMNPSSRLIQKRRHGFIVRARTKKGRTMLAKRRAKGRKRLAA